MAIAEAIVVARVCVCGGIVVVLFFVFSSFPFFLHLNSVSVLFCPCVCACEFPPSRTDMRHVYYMLFCFSQAQTFTMLAQSCTHNPCMLIEPVAFVFFGSLFSSQFFIVYFLSTYM